MEDKSILTSVLNEQKKKETEAIRAKVKAKVEELMKTIDVVAGIAEELEELLAAAGEKAEKTIRDIIINRLDAN